MGSMLDNKLYDTYWRKNAQSIEINFVKISDGNPSGYMSAVSIGIIE